MKAFNIFILEMKKTLSNVKLYVFGYLVVPFIMACVYGLMYQSTFDPSRQISKFSIAIINEDSGDYSKTLSKVFENDSLSKLVSIKDVKSSDDAHKKLIDGSIVAEIYVPQNFSNDIASGKNVSVKVIKSPMNETEGEIIADVTKVFVDNANVYYSVNSSIYKNLTDKEKAAALVSKIQPEINSILSKNYIGEETLEKTKKLSSKQFYAEGMFVMFGLFFITAGASSLLKEKENGTLMRLHSTSTGKSSIIAGKFLSIFLFSIVQAAVFIVLTSLVLNISWGESIPGILTVSLVQCFFVSCMSVFCGTVFKTQKGMVAVIMPILAAMSGLSGTFYPTDNYPKALKTITHFTANYWLFKGYSNTALGLNLNSIALNLLILVLIGISVVVIGYMNFKFDKSEVA